MNAPLPEHIRKALETVTLDDKYSLDYGRAFMSGVQALVKLPMLQRLRDARAGKNTAGFISGYRGSPLGGYDQALWKADKYLKAQNIVFQPGVNEELAATALWGTQQLGFTPAATHKFDGVFGIWYGKGPGVDRSSDAFKHANLAGTTPWGGVIAVAGDDHVAKSSTAAHQSDHIFKACGLPVFFPASVQEILDLGIHAFALSRYASVWSGHEDDPGDRRVRRDRDDRSGTGRDPHSHRFRDAAGRAAHSLARRAAGAGGAPVRIQVVRGARLHPREPAEPQRDRRPERPLRHRRQRQGLQRHEAGPAGPGPGRRHLPPAGHPPAQGRRGVAARGAGHPRVRPRPARDPGGRGKAADDRVPDQGAALRLARRRAAGRGGQVPRSRARPFGRGVVAGQSGGQHAAARERRALAAADRARHRRAAAQAGAGRRHRRAHRRATRDPGSQGARDAGAGGEVRAHALVLLRLSAQHVHRRARGFARDGRDRLPLHGRLDGPFDDRIHADGRRGRALGRPAALLHRAACVRQHRRRHLFPQRPAGDPPVDRGRCQRHLQDPLQRRRGDDRRPAGGRAAGGPFGDPDRAQHDGRGRRARGDRHR